MAAPASSDGRVHRRLAAILAADINGYSALMDGDEDDTHRRVSAEMDRLVQEIGKSGGSIFSFAGDGLMAEFSSAVEALKCALRVQAETADRATGLPPHQRIQYRIGINAGEVLSQRDHMGGTAVNIAARLEQMAAPGSIFLSEAVYDQVNHAVPANYDRIGQPILKNLREPVVVFSISPDECRTLGGPSARGQDRIGISAAAADPRASLAVLPVRIPQPEPQDLSFAEGVLDDVVRILVGSRDLVAVVRSAMADVPRSVVDLRRIRHDLGVRYVLHGTLRRSHGRLRLAVELNDAEYGRVLWADRFDGDLVDPFAFQDRVALRIATAVAPCILESELNRGARLSADDLTAYDLTLRAATAIHRMQRDDFSLARAFLLQALERDPAFRPAHLQLAWWHVTQVAQGWSEWPDEDAAAADAAVQVALARDPNDPHALAMAGHIQAGLHKDQRAAAGMLERALAAAPGCAWAWSFAGLAAAWHGRGSVARERASQALLLSPLGPDAGWHEHVLALAHYVTEDYQAAVDWAVRASDRTQGHVANLLTLVASLAAIGHLEEARGYARRLLVADPLFQVARFRQTTPMDPNLAGVFAKRLRLAGLPG